MALMSQTSTEKSVANFSPSLNGQSFPEGELAAK